MKTIDAEADRLYKHWKVLETATTLAKEDLMKHMASLPEGHTSAFCSYIKTGQTFDTSVAAIMAMSERIEVPTKTVQDWGAFKKLVKGRIDYKGLCEEYPLYKPKKAYLRSEKQVA